MSDREFWLMIRQALLMFVDAIERRWGIPRTTELRAELKRFVKNGAIIEE
jgi:hypothetical protein